MKEFRVKLRSVRFKNGGFIRVIPSAVEKHSAERLGELNDQVRWMNELFRGEFAGFILHGWDYKGLSSTIVSIAPTSPFGGRQLPEIAAEAVRRELSERDAYWLIKRVVFNQKPSDD
jgi:hypothetical protein